MKILSRKINNNLQNFLFCSVSILCLASPVYADDSYLIQLGSSDTKEQAEQKWQDVKSKNADLLGSLTPHIEEVSLSDDGKTSYRTQAGPVESRDTAVQLCAKLKEHDVDCTIVETAMLSEDSPTAAPAATPADQETKAQGETKEKEAEPKKPVELAAAPAPVEEAPVPPAATSVESDKVISDKIVPERAPRFLDDDQPAKSAAVAQAPAETPPAPPAEEKPAAEIKDITPATPAVASAEPSKDVVIPDRAPKFLDDDTSGTSKATSAATPAPAPEVKEVAANTTASRDIVIPERAPKFLDDDVPAAQPVAAAPQPAPEPAEAKPEPVKVAASEDEGEESPAESRRPTLFGHGHKKSSRGTEIATARAAAASPPVKAEDSKPGFFARLFGSSETPETQKPKAKPATAVATGNAEGSVSVAEAIRVPLTEDANSTPVLKFPDAPAPAAHAHAPTLGGIYWAQVNYFPDEAQAHYFYEDFRNRYPDLSDGVRMRVTRPYAYADKSGHVTLKIGSFASAGDIQDVCALAATRNLHCVSIRETGSIQTASATEQENMRTGDPGARKPILDDSFIGQDSVADPVYWVQLGSYDSPDDAWDKWRTLQKHFKKAIGKTSADVAQPQSSSAVHKIYRLRAGPFSARAAADSLCGKLAKSGEGCLVVGER